MPAMARERRPVEEWNVKIDQLAFVLGYGKGCGLDYDQAAVDRVVRKFVKDRAELDVMVEAEMREARHFASEFGTEDSVAEHLCHVVRNLAANTFGFLPQTNPRGTLCWRVADCLDSWPGAPLLQEQRR
jgi:hypothetical protein